MESADVYTRDTDYFGVHPLGIKITIFPPPYCVFGRQLAALHQRRFLFSKKSRPSLPLVAMDVNTEEIMDCTMCI